MSLCEKGHSRLLASTAQIGQVPSGYAILTKTALVIQLVRLITTIIRLGQMRDGFSNFVFTCNESFLHYTFLGSYSIEQSCLVPSVYIIRSCVIFSICDPAWSRQPAQLRESIFSILFFSKFLEVAFKHLSLKSSKEMTKASKKLQN